MISVTVTLTHKRDEIKINIDIDKEQRTIRLSGPSESNTFKMDIDPYPMKGPLYHYIKQLCDGNKYQMMKLFYPINQHRGLWDKYILF